MRSRAQGLRSIGTSLRYRREWREIWSAPTGGEERWDRIELSTRQKKPRSSICLSGESSKKEQGIKGTPDGAAIARWEIRGKTRLVVLSGGKKILSLRKNEPEGREEDRNSWHREGGRCGRLGTDSHRSLEKQKGKAFSAEESEKEQFSKTSRGKVLFAAFREEKGDEANTLYLRNSGRGEKEKKEKQPLIIVQYSESTALRGAGSALGKQERRAPQESTGPRWRKKDSLYLLPIEGTEDEGPLQQRIEKNG